MADFLKFDGPPSSWIVEGGRPARCMDWRGHLDGWPSYYQENGLAVMELLVGFRGVAGNFRLIPYSYNAVARDSPEGLVRLRTQSGRSWRPAVYYLSDRGGWVAQGSQQELTWRFGVAQALREINEGVPMLDMSDSTRRAQDLLKSMLNPLQRIELAVCGGFQCRGGCTGNLYWIKLGDGFSILDKTTCEMTVSYCYHPDHWLPDADVALATKLVLEDPELEPEALETAKRGPMWKPRRPKTRRLCYARDAERELMAA